MSLENENKPIPSYSEFLSKGNATNIEKREYTDEEYRKMATKISQKEIGEYDNWNDIIVEALLELGAPKEILSDEVCRDKIIHTIIEKNHINKDGSVKDLTENISLDRRNVQNMENLVRTLNENLVINDNSIAGINTKERENDFIQEMQMFSIDTNGLLKANEVEYAMSADRSWVRMIEDVYELDKGEREQVYHKVVAQDILKENELNQLTIENAMQIISIPNREFRNIIEKGQSDVFKEEKNENIVETFLSGLSEWREGEKGRDLQKKDARSEAIENVVSMFTKEETKTDQKPVTKEEVLSGEKIEKLEYTDKEYERMANKVAKNSGKNMDGIAIIEQSLMQLGVPQELLQSPDYKPMIYSMVNQYLYEDNGKGEAIFGRDKQGCETVLRTLNENFVIRDNYIAGIETTKASTRYESAEKMTELFMDENGVVLENIEQWSKYKEEDRYCADKTGYFRACSLDEQGEQELLAYQKSLGGKLYGNNIEQMRMKVDIVRELQGENDNLKRNEVYQEAVDKKQREETSLSEPEGKRQEEQTKQKEQQKGAGILSRFIGAYDNLDITTDYLGSIKELIRGSLDKDKEREQEEQK